MNKNKILLCIFIISLVILLINTLKISILKDNPSFFDTNIELAIYLNDEETNTIPSKEGNIYD